MPDTRVMVVDDSAAMRALFCDILDNAKGVNVCGVASNADDARSKMGDLKPDVLTLDVEMPGMSGLDFLVEIMEERPMPVIMLSSIAQAGSGTAKKALELGAVHCFPKPLHSSREEFDATVAKLGDIVIRAANGTLASEAENDNADAAAVAGGDAESAASSYESDGRIVVMACGDSGIASAKAALEGYPVNCPPTIILIDAEPQAVEAGILGAAAGFACDVQPAADGKELKPGCVYIGFDRANHVIVEAAGTPRIRCVGREPVGGLRPSADLLLGSIARARLPAAAGLLSGTGADGAKGLQILSQTGGKVFVENPPESAPRDRFDAVGALGIQKADVKSDGLAAWILENTAKA